MPCTHTKPPNGYALNFEFIILYYIQCPSVVCMFVPRNVNWALQFIGHDPIAIYLVDKKPPPVSHPHHLLLASRIWIWNIFQSHVTFGRQLIDTQIVAEHPQEVVVSLSSSASPVPPAPDAAAAAAPPRPRHLLRHISNHLSLRRQCIYS